MRKVNTENFKEKASLHKRFFSDGISNPKKKRRKKQFNKFKIQETEISANTEEENLAIVSKIKNEEPIKPDFSPLWLNYKPRSTTLIKSGELWFTQLLPEKHDTVPLDLATKKNLKVLAQKILQQDVENFNRVEERSKNNDTKFRKTVFSHGTYRDKMAAHVLRCVEAPVHSLYNLNAVIAMVSPKAKGENQEALDSLKQLLDSSLIPKKQVAKKFENHQFSCLLPLLASNREQAEKQLAIWYFEDQLQVAFRRLVSHLTQIASDTVDKTKIMGIKYLVNLVRSHPMQDTEYVLECVTNKLGDPSRKVAAETMRALRNLMEKCPKLKPTVVKLVEILLYRPNVSEKSQYYSICYLKDIILSPTDNVLAAKLIKLYIGFFKASTKKGEVDTRLMGALLRGINRAFPYSQLKGEALDEQLQILYKLCHIVSFAIATQALQLIYQIVVSKDRIEDRFYQVLYKQIHDPAFGTSSGSTAFLNLVFKAMLRDDSIERRQGFFKRLLQVAQYQSPHLMCGILFLISEVLKEKLEMKMALETLLKNTGCDDPNDDLEKFEDIKDEDDDEEEKYEDVEDEENDTPQIKEDIKMESYDFEEDIKPDIKIETPLSSSWFHQANANSAKLLKRNSYDPYLRNPQYCGAHFTPLWELLCFERHFHPSVVVFAKKIIDGGTIDYEGDPLQDFSLIRFLDRFVYKNPKKGIKEEQSSSAIILGSRAHYCPEGARGVAVNTPEFLKLDREHVPEDQRFFHSYFTQVKGQKEKLKGIKEEVDDDEFDEYLRRVGGWGQTTEEDDLDFAAGASVAKPKKGEDDEEMESENEDEEIDDDDEGPFGDIHDADGKDNELEENEFGSNAVDDEDDMEFDEENVAFSDEDDFESQSSKKKGKMSLMKQPRKKKKNDLESLDSMFASADEFAHLLEENDEEENPLPSITSNAIQNKDKSHVKQLRWEMDRADKLKGFGKYKRKGHRNNFQGKNFNKSTGRNFNKSTGRNFNKSTGRSFNKSTRGKAFKARRGRR
ncbi:hypothetical protein SK128_007920 [Halocaridina rubra]|uniref:CCAAT-binding factor domain-containing protein n=1 Tax=Halocaridina rubra TaxID=373956 RepID=A0AAN9A3Q5_HALRR